MSKLNRQREELHASL